MNVSPKDELSILVQSTNGVVKTVFLSNAIQLVV